MKIKKWLYLHEFSRIPAASNSALDLQNCSSFNLYGRKGDSAVYMKTKKFRKGDTVEWIEGGSDSFPASYYVLPYPIPFPNPYPQDTFEKHTGVITHVPRNLKTGFITVRDDKDGSIHLMNRKQIRHLRVQFT
jgi:hypothetical protein